MSEDLVMLHQGKDYRPPLRRRTGSGHARSVGGFIAGLLYQKRHGITRSRAASWAADYLGDPIAAKALNTSGASTGGALVPQDFADEIIDLLRTQTVIRRCDPVIVDMPRGNLTIPRMIGASVAAYQGELDEVVVSQEVFDDIQLNSKKLTCLVPVSNDLLRRPTLDVSGVIRDDFIATMAVREDLAFLTGDGSGGSPIGLLNRVPAANSIVVSPFAAMTNDVVTSTAMGVLLGMTTILKNSMSRMIRPRWISTLGTFAFLRSLRDDTGSFLLREEMDRGTLLGYPFFESQQLPANLGAPYGSGTAPVGSQLLLVDFADVIIADTGRFGIDTSDSAAYPDGAGNVVSSFARDQSVYRAISEHDFTVRHNGSLAVALLPAWVPAGMSLFPAAMPYYAQPLSGDGSAAASTWGIPPSGSNDPANIAAAVPGGTLPGRA